MSTISEQVKHKLNTILIKDYEECQFFFAATHLLKDKIKTIADLVKQDEIDFATLRDTIGELGIYISNIEKGLYQVEECYTKLVEALDKK
jgi:hypothetical protein